MVSGSPTSVVVPLKGDLLHLLDDYLLSLGMSPEEVALEKQAHEFWFGIIEGCQLHGAILQLIKEKPAKWGDFTWKVFVVRSDLPLDEYRKLSIVHNER